MLQLALWATKRRGRWFSGSVVRWVVGRWVTWLQVEKTNVGLGTKTKNRKEVCNFVLVKSEFSEINCLSKNTYNFKYKIKI